MAELPDLKCEEVICLNSFLQTNMCKGKNQMLELSGTSGRCDGSAMSAGVTFHGD